METKLDHKYHLSYITDHNSKELYLCYSCKIIIPSYTKLEKRNGPTKPERLKLYPAKEIIKIYLSNKLFIWEGELSYEINNFARLKPGGRDETWNETTFFHNIQLALQYPYLNSSYLFQIRKNEENNINFEIKLRSDTIINYFKTCQLIQLDESSTNSQEIFNQINLEEISLIKFYSTKGNLERLRMILDRYNSHIINPNIDNIDDSWSALQLAAYRGHTDIVNYLIQKGANINIKSNDGMDPLFCALKGKHGDIFKLLAENGAQILCNENNSDDGNESHLTYALTCGLKEVIEYICRPGGEKMMELEALHGKQNSNSNPPLRFFTTIDGYPVDTSLHHSETKDFEGKKKKSKGQNKNIHKHQYPHQENHQNHNKHSNHEKLRR